LVRRFSSNYVELLGVFKAGVDLVVVFSDIEPGRKALSTFYKREVVLIGLERTKQVILHHSCMDACRLPLPRAIGSIGKRDCRCRSQLWVPNSQSLS
jgi:hypothetical protein